MYTTSRPVWQRHPRYTLSVLVIIITTVCFLSPFQTPTSALRAPSPATAQAGDKDSLSARMELSETIYSKIVQARQGLIRRFGPTPRDVAMYVVIIVPFI